RLETLRIIRHSVTPATLKQNACISELVPVPSGEIRGKIWGPDHGGPALCQRGWAVNCGTFNTPIPLPPEGNLLWAREIPKVMRQEMDDMLRFEKKNEEKKWKVYTYEKAVERYCTIPSAHILLERGLAQVEGARTMHLCFIFISLELQSRIHPEFLLFSEGCFNRIFSEPDRKKFTSALVQGFWERNHTVVTVPGDHHVHLNSPEIVAPFVCDFLQSKVLSQPPSPADSQTLLFMNLMLEGNRAKNGNH
uniref:Uncharacterized protein n=1 Tax=Myripristis murdjan TaxID=586833 RepID=A0A668AQ16_9TELE